MKINSVTSGKVVNFGNLGRSVENFNVSHFKDQEKSMAKFASEVDKFTYDEVFKLIQPTTLKERLTALKEVHMQKLVKIINKLS